MKKLSVIIASLLFFAGATFAQTGSATPQAKATPATGTKAATPSTGSNSQAVKKVPANKAANKPVQTAKTPAAPAK